MRSMLFNVVAAAALGLTAASADAMPAVVGSNASASLPVVRVAGGCGPGLVRGRRGTCLKRRAVFSRGGHVLRPGCGKPVGAGLRTPC